MNIVGIIAEYNPMHNGHIYHIEQAKKLANADYVVVIMSGSFTQQGNIAVINKFDRAKLAIENGADIVIELPTIYSTASAEGFAVGAIKILNSLGIITHIAFGAETTNISSLQKIANIYIEKNSLIITKIKNIMDSGINYANAQDLVMKELLTKDEYLEISKPNNILAIEYLKALKLSNSQIKPILIHRLVADHNDLEVDNSANFTSSTAIRKLLNNDCTNNNLSILNKFIPKNVFKYIASNSTNSNDQIWKILKYEILKLGPTGLEKISEVNEGLENRLYKQVLNSNSYEEYIHNVKTKRYTLSKIKRICIYILLGITKELKLYINKVNYARILKVKNNILLSELNTKSRIPIITKLNEKSILQFEDNISKSLKLDVLSHNIVYYNLINMDFKNNICK